MKLFRQIIKKKYERFNESTSNRKNNYWGFFQIYNMICTINGIQPDNEELNEVTKAWRNTLLNINVEQSLGVMEKFVERHTPLVSRFLAETEAIEKEETIFSGMYERGKGIIGVLSYDFHQH